MSTQRKRVSGRLTKGARSFLLTTLDERTWIVEAVDVDQDLVGNDVIVDGISTAADRIQADWIGEPSESEDRVASMAVKCLRTASAPHPGDFAATLKECHSIVGSSLEASPQNPGWTQSQHADHAGLGQDLVSKIQTGHMMESV